MSIIQEAKEELNSGLVAYTEFVLDFKKKADNIYCFFEGKEDRSYYSFRTNLIYHNENYFDYICNGKDNVLKLYKLINNHLIYSKSNVGYFVDYDFDGVTLPKEVYTTPYYSIENFYVVDKAFENILINEFNISRKCPCFREAKTKFTVARKKFHQKIIFLNAWLACQNDYRRKKGIKTRLNIEDSLKKVITADDFNKIVSSDLITINFPQQLITQQNIESIFCDSPKIEKTIFERKLLEFKKVKGEEVFRGKFELKFLVSFLNRFKDEIGKRKNSAFQKRYSTPLRFEYVTSISQLTNNAVTPQCLIEYIKAIKKTDP